MSRIAVIGLVGRSMFFDVPRFHAGGETIVARDLYEEWGGKGFNQAVAAARQGAQVSFLGACAVADVPSITTCCRQEGMVARLCAKLLPTATAAILTDGSGETRVTVYPGAELESADVAAFAEAIVAADVLLLNNEVPEAVNLAAAALAQQHHVKIVFNPAPARSLPPALIEAVSIFTPNEFEAKLLAAGRQPLVSGAADPEIVTTLGARGCRIRSTGEIIPAPPARAVDSTGAGDTFTAVLAVRLAEGETLHAACVAANAAAAESVTRRFVLPSIPKRKGEEHAQ